MPAGQIIGLDLGMSKTGVARASSLARLAEPLQTVATSDLLAYFASLAKNQPIEAVVVGLPRNLNGDETGQTVWVRQWVATAKTEVKLPFYWQDEALTSELAARKIQTLPTGRQAPKFKHQTTDEDAVAAAIILQDFLDSDPENRVMC